LKACSCGSWTYDDIDEIFIGKIIRSYNPYPFSDYEELAYVVKVEKKWKGNSSNRLKVLDFYSCGYSSDLWKSEEVIIYAIHHSDLAELLYSKIDHETYKFLSSLGFKKATSACLYFPSSFTFDSVSMRYETISLQDEVARLDSVFIDPVKLRPYYLNLKNFFLLSMLGLSGFWFWRRKRKDPSPDVSESV